MPTALLLGRDEAHEVSVDDVPTRVRGDTLLWVEVDADDGERLRSVADALGIDGETCDRLVAGSRRAAVRAESTHLHVSLLVPSAADGKLVEVHCLVGDRWLVTVSRGEVDAISDFRERVTGGGGLGELDPPSFLAVLLEWAIEGYLAAFDAVEDELEQVDVALMRAAGAALDATLDRLVGLRRRTARLRRALGDQRRIIAAFAHPELDALSTEESAERFARVLERLDQALGVAESARDSVLGSFDLVIARSGQRTNDIMKVLTLASVLLLPTTALAGVMGMNFKVALFDHAGLFWVVIGVMACLAAATLGAARLRRWI